MMPPGDEQLVHAYVDAALAFRAAHDLLREPALGVPAAMIDPTYPSYEGFMGPWVHWQAIPSTVTAAQIREVEQLAGTPLPAMYGTLLQYRHFLELDEVGGVSFIQHVPHTWQDDLHEHYFHILNPANRLLQQGFIPFAYYMPEGQSVCFATRQPSREGQDCAIVVVTDLYQDPSPTRMLYASFYELMLALRAAQQARDSAATLHKPSGTC